MNRFFSSFVQSFWYREMYLSSFMMPISMLFADIVRFRRFLYRIRFLKRLKVPVPVVVVGNLTVGGTGKTPLVIYLADLLKAEGYKPGILTRGYLGNHEGDPLLVNEETDVKIIGDEAVLLFRHSQCPIVVCQNRMKSAQYLIDNTDIDIILSDDGLQHYALDRDIEIIVIDGQRRLGNGYCLPIGPLREPATRLAEVDFIVVNSATEINDGEYSMSCKPEQLVNLQTSDVSAVSKFDKQPVHAVAGIGNPNRFFKDLVKLGYSIHEHSFPDHHLFVADDLVFGDQLPVIMTEKDAVKCLPFAQSHHWFLPIKAVLSGDFNSKFLLRLKEINHG